jgi:hypothetical protein
VKLALALIEKASRGRNRTLNAASLLLAGWMLASSAACGAASPSAPTLSGQVPLDGTVVPTITVTAAGVSPVELTIERGSRVRFWNRDSQPHAFYGGPDPFQPECIEIDQTGLLAPGQSRDSFVFASARTCRYHDHFQIGITAFEGRIIVRDAAQ